MDSKAVSEQTKKNYAKQSLPITQAMILAAGKGTRLRPLTLETPKPLVKVGGQPLIVWHIKALKAAGITDITINTSWLSSKLMAALGNGSDYGVAIHWSVEDDQPLETAGGIAKALREGCLRQEPFLLINGDVWTEFDFASIKNYKLKDLATTHLLMIDNPDHNSNGDFGINDGFASDTATSGQKYTFAGISIMTPSIVEGVAEDQVVALAPLLKESMQQLKVTAEVIDCKWVDVGTPQRLDAVNQYVLEQGSDITHSGRPIL